MLNLSCPAEGLRHPVRSTPADSAHLHILLVDDDPRYVELCQRYLSRSKNIQFIVSVSSTIKEALTLCKTTRFDCMVVDYMLPDGLGTKLIGDLYSQAGKVVMPSIVTTADGGEDAATRAIRAGAIDFISKRDINKDSLKRSIENAVYKYKLADSLEIRNRELEEANRNLEKNRQEIMHFYHTVSHEVKTPLSAIREFVCLIRDGAGGQVSEVQRNLIQMTIESCDQITRQFTELLEVTRMESGKLVLKPDLSCTKRMFDRCIASVSDLARSKNIEVFCSVQSFPPIYADADRIVQVISNLLNNAVKFTDFGGEVELGLKPVENGRYIEIFVRDTGCGIADHELSSVFDRLYQCDVSNTAASSPGLGLGLAIAREIMTLHRSELKVESRIDEGSRFSFTLPTERAHALQDV